MPAPACCSTAIPATTTCLRSSPRPRLRRTRWHHHRGRQRRARAHDPQRAGHVRAGGDRRPGALRRRRSARRSGSRRRARARRRGPAKACRYRCPSAKSAGTDARRLHRRNRAGPAPSLWIGRSRTADQRGARIQNAIRRSPGNLPASRSWAAAPSATPPPPREFNIWADPEAAEVVFPEPRQAAYVRSRRHAPGLRRRRAHGGRCCGSARRSATSSPACSVSTRQRIVELTGTRPRRAARPVRGARGHASASCSSSAGTA